VTRPVEHQRPLFPRCESCATHEFHGLPCPVHDWRKHGTCNCPSSSTAATKAAA
jgi:hypothetical protein